MPDEECTRPNIFRSDYKWMLQFGEGEGKSPKGSLMRKIRERYEELEVRISELEEKLEAIS